MGVRLRQETEFGVARCGVVVDELDAPLASLVIVELRRKTRPPIPCGGVA